LKAIVLAAGEGKRLQPLTLSSPKCLVNLFGKSILEWQLQVFRSCNIWKLSKELIVFLLLRITVLCTSCLSYHYETVLHCLNFFSAPRFSIRGKINPQKLNIFFLVQDRRNYRLYDIYTIIYRCPVFLSSQHMISPKATQSCVLSGEATNTNLIVFGWLDRGSSIWYIALEEMTLTISPLHRDVYMTMKLTAIINKVY